MNKRNLPRMLLLAATVSLASAAGAQTVDNWTNGDGSLARRNGTHELCWRNSNWTPPRDGEICARRFAWRRATTSRAAIWR